MRKIEDMQGLTKRPIIRITATNDHKFGLLLAVLGIDLPVGASEDMRKGFADYYSRCRQESRAATAMLRHGDWLADCDDEKIVPRNPYDSP